MGYKDAILSAPAKGWFKSLVGTRSDRLFASEYYGHEPTKHGPIHYYRCVCDCGGEAIVSAQNLRRSSGKNSCGCRKLEEFKERSVTHGMSRSSEYNSWQSMRARCYNSSNPAYRHYGGRGITVCDRWMDSFENFFSDMGRKPSAKHSIERVDVDGNYEPGNCKWATDLEQGQNHQTHHLVTTDGGQVILSEAIRAAGLPAKAVSNRLSRGWPVDRALKTPLNAPRKVRTRPNAVWVEVDGEPMLLRAACTRLGKPYKTVHARIKRGRAPQEALDM